MGRDLIEKGYAQGVCQLVIELLNGTLRVVDVPRAARSRGGGEQQRAWFGPRSFQTRPRALGNALVKDGTPAMGL